MICLRSEHFLRVVALATIAVSSLAAHGQPVDLATKPITTINTDGMPIPPNMMFVFDESGSMQNDYMPDFARGVDDTKFTNVCRNPTSAGTRSCRRGDPPSAAFRSNLLYYNPSIVYTPPVDADGTSSTFKSYDNSPGWSWTAVRTNGYDLSSPTIDLTSGFVETVYCNSASPTNLADPTQCRANGTGYSRTGVVGYPVTTGVSATTFIYPKPKMGAPYYYDIEPTEWCSDRGLRNCGSTVQTATYPFPAYVRFCNSNTAATAAPGASTWPAGSPFNPKMLTSGGPNPPSDVCQAQYISNGGSKSFIRARFGRFVRYDISPTDAAQMTNFANWYAYHRIRHYVVKHAAGRAMASVGTSFNVGYLSSGFSPGVNSTNNLSRILPSRAFTGDHRIGWYSRMYGYPIGAFTTNLAAPLSLAGRYFAGEYASQPYRVPGTALNATLGEPTTRTCQANFAIVLSDGAWVESDGAAGYGGNPIGGDVDAGAARPFFCADCTGGVGKPSLADVAQYLYVTDMKPSLANHVPTNQKDSASHQHVTTFSIGFGVGGALTYQPRYEAANDSDYQQIRNGSWDWPSEGAGSTLGGTPFAVDDLWHAAVNGRGEYFAANDSGAVIASINSILSSMVVVGDSTAAASTVTSSTLSGTSRSAFLSQFTNQVWTGDLIRVLLDKAEGTVESIQWRASDRLPTSHTSRRVLTANGSGSGLVDFSWANLQAADFPVSLLSHYSSLTAPQKLSATTENLINYLRGDRAYEAMHNDLSNPDLGSMGVFRKRESILGDIVGSEAAVADGVVYVGSNSGMLHAFNADTGEELWAFVPSIVRGQLYKLADKNYNNNHNFYVDGSPVVELVCTSACGTASAVNRRVLVSGLSRGGRGYFALDVTVPSSPTLLWEFSAGILCAPAGAGAGQRADCDLGFSYGNPVVTKVRDEWSVLFTSGYNNDNSANPPGSGGGYLYILGAFDGKLRWKVPTQVGSENVGTPLRPSGLSKLAAYAENYSVDNLTLRAYAGDLLGNLWRFNLDVNPPSATLLAYTDGSSGQGSGAQPISGRPEVTNLNGTVVVVFGTGQLLGTPDFSTTGQQAIYAIKDTLGPFGIGRLKDSSSLVKQQFVPYTDPANPTQLQYRTSGLSNVDWGTKNGWYVELQPGKPGASGTPALPSERIFTDPVLNLGTIAFTSFVPPEDPCGADGGGRSVHYAIDVKTGNLSGVAISGIATRPVVIKTDTGKLVSLVRRSIGITKDGAQTETLPVKSMAKVSSGRRVNWREVPIK